MANIYDIGIDTVDLFNFFTTVKDNFNGVLTKLDADSGVTDTDYNSTHALTIPTDDQATGLTDRAMSQAAIVAFLQDIITQFNGALTKLDSDAGVTDDDYNSTTALTDNVNPDPADYGDIQGQGMNQQDLVTLLNSILTQINALNAKLDLDGTVNDTDYASTYDIADTVIE